MSCTLASSLLCSLYGRDVDILPVESSGARLRGLQFERLYDSRCGPAAELDAVELNASDATEGTIGSSREHVPLPLAGAAAKGVATTTFAMLTPEAVLCNEAWGKLIGSEPIHELER